MASRLNIGLGLMAGATVIGSLAGGVSSSVLSNSRGTASGSLIVQGDTYYVTNNLQDSNLSNENPSLRVNSGSFLTVATSGDTPGGGVKLTASGTRNYVANYSVPGKYASGAVLDRVTIECGNAYVTTGSLVANQVVLKASITTGDVLRSFIRIQTGSLTTSNSGATVGTKLTAGTYLSFITNASGGQALFNTVKPTDCVMKPILHEKYGR